MGITQENISLFRFEYREERVDTWDTDMASTRARIYSGSTSSTDFDNSDTILEEMGDCIESTDSVMQGIYRATPIRHYEQLQPFTEEGDSQPFTGKQCGLECFTQCDID